MQQKDLSIGHRLFIGFGVAFILLVAQILMTFAFLQRIGTLESRQDGLIAPRREAAEAMHAALLEQAVSLLPEPLYVFGDPARLQQVLTNLLTNAAKYTPQQGQVSVTVEGAAAAAVIRVRDTGRGIPREMLPRIFDLFVQADRSLDRTEGGLGIGLTMVQRLVEMHGGHAEAHSDGPGRGSTFTIRLPTGTPQGEVDPMQTSLRGELQADSVDDNVVRRVLVVDDNRDAAETLVALVELWGHEARAAHDGPSAIDIARRYRPDTILLDIGLPGMDGYEVAKRLRSEGSATKTFLAAVTGYGEDSARQQSEDAGFDCHLTKPVDPEALRDLLARGGSD